MNERGGILNVDRLRRESSLLSPNDVCAQILALSIVEYTYTPSVSIAVDSERGGEAWSQSYRYGKPLGPPRMLGSTGMTGTTITFETAAPIDHAAFTTLVNTLISRIPGLLVTLRT